MKLLPPRVQHLVRFYVAANFHKTAPQGLFALHFYEFARFTLASSETPIVADLHFATDTFVCESTSELVQGNREDAALYLRYECYEKYALHDIFRTLSRDQSCVYQCGMVAERCCGQKVD